VGGISWVGFFFTNKLQNFAFQIEVRFLVASRHHFQNGDQSVSPERSKKRKKKRK
jgi:hypothetical protein